MTEDDITKFPPGHYGVISADPPWAFKPYSRKNLEKMPDAHYVCMDLDWIKNLPVASLAAPDCALILWATAPMLPRAFETMESWGFQFKTAGAWAKQSSTGRKLAFGTGYVYRSAAEFWLFGTRGKPKSKSKSIRNLILAPVREHSRKPDQMRTMIETQFDGPYLELFGRQGAENWDTFGNQVNLFSKKEG